MREFLTDVRVLSLAQLLPGQYTTSLLADLGAEVILVEHPEGGNPSRHRQPTVDGRGGAHLIRDQDKRSVALNLKDERGSDAFLDIAETADIVLEGFRPGTVDRLGVGYDDVQAVNERIVYCSLTGYGQDGPYASLPGHDINYGSLTGLLDLTGNADDPPTIPGYPVADLAGALYASTAITAALAGATDDGTYLDVSMTDVLASFSVTYADKLLRDEPTVDRGQTNLTGAHPGYRVYQTADEKYISLGALENHFWTNLCEATDHPEYAECNFHFAASGEDDRAVVINDLAKTLRKRPREEWLERFTEYDVPAAPVLGLREMFSDPHLQSRGIFLEKREAEEEFGIDTLTYHHRFGDAAETPKEPAPRCGADTVEILTSIGYTAEELCRFEREDVVSIPS
jgi:crotonobetainyl-CoA:carnitine CoA-transferase CaiB-like acyl-CoA transferase